MQSATSVVDGLAAVAQLDRVLGYEPRGRGFDSCQPHQIQASEMQISEAFVFLDVLDAYFCDEKNFSSFWELRVIAYSIIGSLAAVAQLDRVLGYEPRGRGFDSCQPHQLEVLISQGIRTFWFVCCKDLQRRFCVKIAAYEQGFHQGNRWARR
jgi:hypothetical protein